MEDFRIKEIRDQFTKQDDFLLKQIETIYRQTEDLTAIYSILKPRLPLPRTRGWAASPDFLRKIIDIVLANEANLIVEASSGVSTLVVAYCLEKLGRGKVISYEHDKKFAELSANNIKEHGLDGYSEIIYAPLKEQVINNKTYSWYDSECINVKKGIDVLIIDGPPGSGQSHARYPALPFFYDYLSEKATVLLDDSARLDELQIIEMWQEEFPSLKANYLHLEKGACILTK